MAVASLAQPRRKTLKAGAAPRLQLVTPEVIPNKPTLGEVGVDGIGNFAGDLQSEVNPALIRADAYGIAGTRVWGQWEKLVRTDPAAAMALDFVIAPIRDARVDINPPADAVLERLGLASKKDFFQRQADLLTWNLKEHLEPSLPEFLQQTCRGSLGVGFSLHELIWEAVDHPSIPGGHGLVVKELAERLPSTVYVNAWQEDELGNLVSIRQQGLRGQTRVTVDLPVGKVLLNTWNRNGKNYAGFSAFRSVWYHARIREQLLKLTGIALVREGAGIPVAKSSDAKAKLTPAQRKSFEKLLANLVYHENASAVLPAGWDLEWVFSPAANKGHVVDTYNALGLHILMQLGAQQLHLGTGSTGSRSVGQVHAAEADAVRRGVIANLLGVINGVGARRYTGLLKKITDANFGPQPVYCTATVSMDRPSLDPDKLADALTKGKAAGVFTPTFRDELSFREATGQPVITEDERDEAKEKAAALAPPAPPPFGGAPVLAPGQKPNPFEKASLRAAAVPFVPSRPLRPSEQNLNLTAMAKVFDEAPVEFANEVRPLVAEMLTRALPAITAAIDAGDPSAVGDIKLDTKRLDTFVGVYLEGLRAKGYAEVHAEMKRARPVRGAAEEDDKYGPDSSPASDDAQGTLEATRKHLVKRMAQRLTSDLEKEAIDVDRTDGDAAQVVVRTIEAQTTANSFKQDAALVTTKAFNVGRQEFAEEHSGEIESAELSAAMDSNTCGPCDRLDGEEFEFGSDEEVAHTPPLSSICDGGDRCRCVKVFNFKKPGAGGGEAE